MKRILALLLTLLLLLSVMWMIWSFSAMDAEESSAESGSIVELLIDSFFHSFPAMSAEKQEQLTHILTVLVRKSGHFAEYTLLGFCMRLHIAAIGGFRTVRRPAAAAWLLSTVYAASDEIHQIFVPGRGPAVKDVLLDSCGTVLGVLLCTLIVTAALRRRAKTTESEKS